MICDSHACSRKKKKIYLCLYSLMRFTLFLQNEFGVWEIFLPNNADGTSPIPHGSRVKVAFPFLCHCFWLVRISPKLTIGFLYIGENGYAIRDKGFNSCLDQVLSAGPRRNTIRWDLLRSS